MIFISYSSKDGDIANKICEGLEAKQHHCWIAPRDINPGESYPSAIMRGLNECKVMLIIVSDNSILSRHVLNEVEQAFKSETAIIPVRIADIVPSGDLDYFLSLTQWFDVISGDVEQHIDDLATKIRPLVAQGNKSVSSTVASPPPPIPDPKPEPEPKSKSSSKPLLMALIAIIVVILGFLIYSFMPAPEPTMDGFTEAVMVDKAIPNREINIKISTEPNKSIYHDGDKIILSVTTETAAWVVAILHASDGSKLLLYPNDFAEMRKLSAGETIKLGAPGSGFDYNISEPFGTDLIQVIASEKKDILVDFFEESTPLNGINIRSVNAQAIERKISRLRGIKITQQSAAAGQGWGHTFVLIESRANQ